MCNRLPKFTNQDLGTYKIGVGNTLGYTSLGADVFYPPPPIPLIATDYFISKPTEMPCISEASEKQVTIHVNKNHDTRYANQQWNIVHDYFLHFVKDKLIYWMKLLSV